MVIATPSSQAPTSGITSSITSSSSSSGAFASNYEKVYRFQHVKDVDVMLATDLNQLSLQEREKVFEKIHGVEDVVIESEELIQKSLKELAVELDLIRERTAYDMGLQASDSCRDYLESRKFRLMFLRSENFCIAKAAMRLVTYMEKMLEYFGQQVLGRPLYYSDLHPDTKAFLKKGTHQVVHQARDSAGRTIFLDHYEKAEKIKKSNIALVQTYIYNFYCAIENDDLTQIKGMICVGYNIGKLEKKFDSEAYKGVPEIGDWFPIKIPAIHVCFHSPALSIFAPLAWVAMGPKLRQKVRIHNGTHMEVMYALQGFGIPVNTIPVNEKGTIKNAVHHKFLARRQAKEAAMKESDQPLDAVIDVPAPNDVVLWRGRIYQQHPGNLRMRTLIDEYREEYDKSQKGAKAEIAMQIVTTIQTVDRGRFLTQVPSGGWWMEVSDKEAQLKVSKSFRSSRATVTKYNKAETGNGNKRLRTVSPADDVGCEGNCCFSVICEGGAMG